MAARLPVFTWVPGYQRDWVRGDLVAGVTITAYLVPQVMANAELAGLPAAVGLWAAVGGLIGYSVLGTSRQLSMGPESATALMTAAAIGSVPSEDRGAFAAALALAVALLCGLGWLARLGALADLLSRPVLVGYMAGIAGVMIASQLDLLMGVVIDADDVVDEVIEAARHVPDVHGPTLILGVATLAAMLLASARFPKAPVALLGMLGATAAVALLDLRERGVAVVGDIPAGFPQVRFTGVSFGDVLGLLGPALGIAFVAFTDTILTGRAFVTSSDERVDAKRELLALGTANLGAGLLQGFPVSSSGSRTAIGHAVGGRSQLTGLVTCVCALLAVLLARPVLEAFPSAGLGAVVVYAAIKLIDIPEFVRFGRFRTSELLLAVGTTVAVLAVGVLYGALVAIGLSVLDLLRRVARPHDAILGYVPGLAGMHDVDDYGTAEPVPGLVVYRYDSPLFFANAENFHARALAAVDEQREPVRWFVLNTEAIVEVDVTAVDVLEALRAELAERGIVMGMARLKQDLRHDLEPSGLLERIGDDYLFPTLPTAVEAFRTWERTQRG